MNTRRWTTHKRPTAIEQRAAVREKALDQCGKGQHTSTPTFRPGETVCIICGMVLYCPDCLKQYQLQLPLVHAYPVLCLSHKKVEE